jgi:hypothetical protein
MNPGIWRLVCLFMAIAPAVCRGAIAPAAITGTGRFPMEEPAGWFLVLCGLILTGVLFDSKRRERIGEGRPQRGTNAGNHAHNQEHGAGPKIGRGIA